MSQRAKEYDLPEPEFSEIGGMFRVNLYRPKKEKPIKKADKKPIEKADKKPIKKADKKPINLERRQRIIEYVETHGMITNQEGRKLLGLAESTTKRLLKQMVQEGILLEQGEKRTRVYVMGLKTPLL